MWQKIKCWLGLHEWEDCASVIPTTSDWLIIYKWHSKKCKHCGKVKR